MDNRGAGGTSLKGVRMFAFERWVDLDRSMGSTCCGGG